MFPGFFHALNQEFPLFFPYQVFISAQDIDIFLHPVCAVALHFLSHMAVYIQGKGGSVMAQILLDGLYVVTALQRGYGIRVPLRYQRYNMSVRFGSS